MSTDDQSIEWYDENAEAYASHVKNPEDSIFHAYYEKPAMYALLPDLNGKSAISLGCGSGEDCKYLKEQGAERVVGVDISEGMIGVAKASHPDGEFAVMDMEKLDFPDDSFDFVYSSLAIHYIEDWSKVMSEAYRVLKPGGFFLFSANHPVASALDVTEDTDTWKKRELSRRYSKETGELTIHGDYMTRRSFFGGVGMPVTTWHKSIGEICAETHTAGFLIETIVEPKPLEKMKELNPRIYAILCKIPDFVIFKLYKPV